MSEAWTVTDRPVGGSGSQGPDPAIVAAVAAKLIGTAEGKQVNSPSYATKGTAGSAGYAMRNAVADLLGVDRKRVSSLTDQEDQGDGYHFHLILKGSRDGLTVPAPEEDES